MSTNVLVSELCVIGKRVLISILSSLYNCGQLSQHVCFKIFDTKNCPQLLYGSEIRRADCYDDLESVHVYACKRFMCLSCC